MFITVLQTIAAIPTIALGAVLLVKLVTTPVVTRWMSWRVITTTLVDFSEVMYHQCASFHLLHQHGGEADTQVPPPAPSTFELHSGA